MMNLETLRKYIEDNNIRNVIFDVDLTITAEHSGGMIQKSDWYSLSSYLDSARETDAISVINMCSQMNLRIGIVTFQKECDDSVLVGGAPLVSQILRHIDVSSLIDYKSIVALSKEEYNVMLMSQSTYNKNDMIRKLFDIWEIEFDPGHTLLVDDTVRNVKAFASIGGHGIEVRGRSGLKLNVASYVLPSSC